MSGVDQEISGKRGLPFRLRRGDLGVGAGVGTKLGRGR
jgi:hypothetical protein